MIVRRILGSALWAAFSPRRKNRPIIFKQSEKEMFSANTRLFINEVAQQSLTKIAGSDNVRTRVSKKAGNFSGNSERVNVGKADCLPEAMLKHLPSM